MDLVASGKLSILLGAPSRDGVAPAAERDAGERVPREGFVGRADVVAYAPTRRRSSEDIRALAPAPDRRAFAPPAGEATPLMRAARAGALAEVKALLQAGADPRIADAHGCTAYNHARAAKRYDVAQLLRARTAARRAPAASPRNDG